MFFSSNLKFLRERSRTSQTDLAKSLDLSRTTLIGYEKGVQPPFTKLVRMADYFKVSLDALVRYDLSKLSAFQLSEVERGMDIDITGQKLRLLTVTVDKNGNENIELVGIKAHAGYANGYGDPDFIGQLPRFQLPFLPREKTYRCFQLKGDSMLPIPNGAWVTGAFIEDWNTIKPGTPCIIVTRNDGVVFKLVYSTIATNGMLQLVSTNAAYKPYDLAIREVVEIWKSVTWNRMES